MSSLIALPAALATKASVELNESPEQYASCLAALRHWLALQPHFKARSNDQFLMAFLRASKFSVERAKERIENFYRYRAALPELFENWSIAEAKFKHILTSGALLYLPEPIAIDGPRVIVMRPSNFDMSKHNSLDVNRALFIAVDLMLYEDLQVQVAGFIIVMDLQQVSKEVMLDFNPFLVRKIIDGLNKQIFPARFKCMHMINMPTILEKLYNLVRGAISLKMLERFQVHAQGVEVLDEYIPRRIYPKEYGGVYDITKMQKELLNKLEERQHILLEETNYGMIKGYEQVPAKQNFKGDCNFGINGSFKTLAID